MGTRSLIKIENFKTCAIYKHYDGYPEAMLSWLEAFNKDFTANRGADHEYKAAQLLRYTAFNATSIPDGNSKYTGWGIVPYKSDIGQEYEYTLQDDGTVKVKNV